jgi:protein-S-isoprenylcysteine O-methyltransferase Ste14
MMRPLVFHDTAAAILFFSSGILANAIAVALLPRPRIRIRDSSGLVVAGFMIAGIVCAGAIAWFRVTPIPGNPWLPTIAGILLMWTGYAFRAWSIVTLGRFFQLAVVVQADHRVIDNGPYRWVRHPAYLGAIVSFVGIGLAEADWLSVVVMLAGALIGLIVRIRVEERALLAGLGEDYATFTRGRARLVPGLF